MTYLEAIKVLWPLVIAFVSLVVWLIRLEGRVNFIEVFGKETQKDVDKLRNEHDALHSKMLHEIMEVKQSLARIEGRLEGIFKPE